MIKNITKNTKGKLVLKSWVMGFAVCMLAGTAYAQNWQHQDVNTTLNLYSVHFVDADTGWAAGANDRVYKTTDGGQIWNSFSTGASTYISDLHFFDSENGWLSASNGIKYTEDGGESWIHSYNTTTQMFSVYFTDGENGWAAGAGGTIIHTSDGGANWGIQTTPVTDGLNSIFFTDLNTGWAAGVGGVVLRTMDGGTTWNTQNSGTAEVLNSIFFIDGSIGWIVGESGTILHTTDGGGNWEDQGGSTPSDLFDIYFINNIEGRVVGSDGTILSTSNGGDNWGGETSGTSVRLSGIYMTSGDTGFAVGLDGVALFYGDHPRLSPPELVSPGISETDVIFRPLFEWNDDSGAETYNLQISTDESFEDAALVVDETGISGTSYSPDENLADDTSYFWRVQGVDDEGGTSSWAAARSFTTTEFWIAQNTGSVINFSDIHFGDTETGWVSGEGGAIWITTDAGVNWQQLTTPISVNLNALHFTDIQNGWAVGDNGTILNTTTGTSWSEQGGEITSTLLDVYFADASTGWVVGVNGFLSKTTDGGGTWEEQDPGTAETLWGVHFVSSQVGWLVGANGTIARTDNGGDSWQAQESGVSGTLNNAFFLNAEYGWIAGRNGIVLRTTNGGIDWEKLVTNHDDINFENVSFVSNEHGWVVGEAGLILSTEDGGDTWQEQESGILENLTGIHFVVAGAGWITGDGGTVLKWYEDPIDAPVLTAPVDNDTQVDRAPTFQWEAVTGAASYVLQISTEASFSSDFMVTEQTGLTGTSYTPGRDLNASTEYFWRVLAVNSTGSAGAWSQVFSFTTGLSWRVQESGVNYLLYDIYFRDEENGWAAGDTSTVLRTSDGGDNWESVNTGSTNNYRGIYFTSPETGFIISTDGSLLQTDDGGANWQVRSIGAENALLSIDFSDNGNGLIVGVGGIILRTTDGGATWNSVNSNVSENLWYVYFLNDDEVWATGTGGTIIHSSDGGETWETQQAFASGYSIFGVHFIDSERGWASGTDGIVLKTSDGGITWDYNIYTSVHLDKVHFTDENTGWIVGSGGTMLNTTNGGETWDLIETPTSEYLVALSFVGPGKGWAAGSAGTILHYSASVSALPAPFLELPVAGETGVSLLPKLTWASIDEASEYQVQVGTDPNFGFETKVSDATVSETFYTPEELQFESVYYWRVRAVDSDGFGGTWSVVQSFDTVGEDEIYADLDVEGNRLPVSAFFTLVFNLGIEESSLLNAIEIKDSDDFVYTLSVSEAEGSRGSELRAHSETSFRSNDEITVTINSSELVSRSGYDLSGLEDRSFTFTTSFLGDFDNDAGVNSTDLAEITSRWKITGDDNEEEISMFDIGPASGSGTKFRSEPDGAIDFEDLMMFAFNWNLSMSDTEEQEEIALQTMAAANQQLSGRSKQVKTITGRTDIPGSETEGSWPYFMKQAKEVLENNGSGASFYHSFESGNLEAGESAARFKAGLEKSSPASRAERVKLLIPGYDDRYQTGEEAGLQKHEKIALVLAQADSLMAYEVYVQAPEGVSVQDLKVHSVFEKYSGQSFILSKTQTSGNGFVITAANLGKGIQLAEGDTLATFSLDKQSSGLVDLAVSYTLNESTKNIYKGVYSTVADVPGEAPEDFELLENYPNPFNPVTEIRYHIPEKAQVRVLIYDILGRRISTITDQQLEAGFYRARWDASRYASGVYLYVIQVHGDSGRRFTQTKKMTLIK
ncbi:MAG: YCF48-related protein [Balneolaceae bacterium]